MSIKLLLGLCSYMTDDDIASIKRAHAFADHYHDLQIRKSGEPFITHTEHVAMILAQLNQQAETVQAGLLHDVLEDTSCTESDLQKEFGDHVLQMVNGVTKLERINFPSNIDLQAENYRKLFLAMAKDIRIIIIKLADRLHNMRTLHFLPPEKQQRIAKETLEIFAPLSHRLGMGHIKWELEDLSFATLLPDDFKHVKALIKERRDEREFIVNNMCDSTQELLTEHNISVEISGRPKHFYSIYKKIYDDKNTNPLRGV